MCDMKKPDPVWVLRLTTRVKSQNISQKICSDYPYSTIEIWRTRIRKRHGLRVKTTRQTAASGNLSAAIFCNRKGTGQTGQAVLFCCADKTRIKRMTAGGNIYETLGN